MQAIIAMLPLYSEEELRTLHRLLEVAAIHCKDEDSRPCMLLQHRVILLRQLNPPQER